MPLLPKPKRVLLLAVSCKKGGLCPGGVDLDNPSQWIRIVRDDGYAGSVQSFEIDYAQPLDVIEFTGHPVPRGVQKENWAIDFNSCRKVHTYQESIMKSVYEKYGYHGFWKNSRAYLDEYEMDVVDQESLPSESLLHVRNVFIYKNPSGKAKLDFDWGRLKLKGISMTDPDYYDPLNAGNDVRISEAIIVISIPYAADFTFPGCSSGRGYKFVSKIFDCDAIAGEQKQPEPKYEYLEKGIPFGVMPEKQPQHPQPSSTPWQSEHSAVGSSTVTSISDKAVTNQQQQPANAKPIEPFARQQQPQPSSTPWQSEHSAVGSSTVNSISDKAVTNQQQQPANDKPNEQSAQQQQPQASSNPWQSEHSNVGSSTVNSISDKAVANQQQQAANDKPIEPFARQQQPQPSSTPWKSAHSAVGSSTVNSISNKAVANQQQQPANDKPIEPFARQQQPQPSSSLLKRVCSTVNSNVTLVAGQDVIDRLLQAANDKPIEQSSQQQQPQPKPQQQQDDRLTQPIRYSKMLQEAKQKEAAQFAKQSLSKAPQEQTTPKKDFAPKVKLQTQQKPRSTFWAGILKIFGIK